jgi:hypothetical protein
LRAAIAERNYSAGPPSYQLCHKEERLRKIQVTLQGFGVDVESLIGELESIAFKFEGFPYWKYLITPREMAAEIQVTVTMINTLRERLDQRPFNYVDYIDPAELRDAWPKLLFPVLDTLPAQTTLTALRDELQRRIDKLMTMKGGVSNASKVHREYWTALTRLWCKATAHKADQRRQKHLIKFLIACSEPLFPRQTTDSKVTAFVVDVWPSLQTVTA